jgi:hypothetical protein
MCHHYRGMLFYEWVSVNSEHEWWIIFCEQEGILLINFVHVKEYFFDIFWWHGKIFPNTIEFFPCHQRVHVAFNGFKLLELKRLRCFWISISYNRLGTKKPRERGPCLISHGDLWQNLQISFVVVGTYLAIVICRIMLPFVNVWRFVSPMQAIQYTNMFRDNNKLTNRLDTYKYVIKHIYVDNCGVFWAGNVFSYSSLK